MATNQVDARGSQEGIRRAYDLFSHLCYGLLVSPVRRRAIALGIARAAVRPGERVLEVAPGPGDALKLLSGQAGETGLAAGVDISAGMLAKARGRAPRALLARADARRLPFPEASFDVVFSSYFLDLLPTADLAPMVRGFFRVLRPGGRLVQVGFSREGDRRTWVESVYVRTPVWLVPYLFGSCRPIRAESFLREAGFVAIEREFMSGSMGSEVLLAHKPQKAG